MFEVDMVGCVWASFIVCLIIAILLALFVYLDWIAWKVGLIVFGTWVILSQWLGKGFRYVRYAGWRKK